MDFTREAGINFALKQVGERRSRYANITRWESEQPRKGSTRTANTRSTRSTSRMVESDSSSSSSSNSEASGSGSTDETLNPRYDPTKDCAVPVGMILLIIHININHRFWQLVS